MSTYVQLKYQSDANGVYNMRVNLDKVGLVGEDAVVGALTDPRVDVYSGGNGRKRFGLHARGVRWGRVVGVGDAAFKKYVFIPCATKTIQQDLLAEASITYKGQTYTTKTAVEEK